MSAVRVLVVDDDPIQQRILTSLLARWGYEVETAGDGEAALQRLEASPAQLAIVDWMMPRMDGLELCRRIRAELNEPYVYVLLLTARTQRDDVIQGLEAGADDYLTKPVHHGELAVRVKTGRRIIDLQRQLLATQEQLRLQATHDALTGLLNRGALFDALGREHARARREGRALSLIMIDLDHFKQINDRWGHPTGDEVLRQAAQRISTACRGYDLVGRYGGEEFLVVAPGQDGRSAEGLAERLRGLFVDRPIEIDEASLPVTISLGAVTLAPAVEVEQHDLLKAADDALYQAKREGRNRTVVGQL
jgi:diguanylate cyclase (GGDEF)-like protein